MDKIVTRIYPFVLNQKVLVYKNNECVKEVECPLNKLEDTLYNLCKEYDIQEVDLGGNEQFNINLKDNIERYGLSNYDQFQINVNLV